MLRDWRERGREKGLKVFSEATMAKRRRKGESSRPKRAAETRVDAAVLEKSIKKTTVR